MYIAYATIVTRNFELVTDSSYNTWPPDATGTSTTNGRKRWCVVHERVIAHRKEKITERQRPRVSSNQQTWPRIKVESMKIMKALKPAYQSNTISTTQKNTMKLNPTQIRRKVDVH